MNDLLIPTPVEEDYVRRLLVLSSCFRSNHGPLDRGTLACTSVPCACAQSLLQEIGRPLWLKIERLRVALNRLIEEADKFETETATAQRTGNNNRLLRAIELGREAIGESVA